MKRTKQNKNKLIRFHLFISTFLLYIYIRFQVPLPTEDGIKFIEKKKKIFKALFNKVKIKLFFYIIKIKNE
jgi:hypothetical protein